MSFAPAPTPQPVPSFWARYQGWLIPGGVILAVIAGGRLLAARKDAQQPGGVLPPGETPTPPAWSEEALRRVVFLNTSSSFVTNVENRSFQQDITNNDYRDQSTNITNTTTNNTTLAAPVPTPAPPKPLPPPEVPYVAPTPPAPIPAPAYDIGVEQGAIVLYEGPGYTGRSWVFKSSIEMLRYSGQGDLGGGRIKSLKVGPQTYLTIYTHEKYNTAWGNLGPAPAYHIKKSIPDIAALGMQLNSFKFRPYPTNPAEPDIVKIS